MNNDEYITQRWNEVRVWRNKLLQESDWTQLLDSSLTEQAKILYKTYRQQLRDITITYNHPNDVIFPDAPLL